MCLKTILSLQFVIILNCIIFCQNTLKSDFIGTWLNAADKTIVHHIDTNIWVTNGQKFTWDIKCWTEKNINGKADILHEDIVLYSNKDTLTFGFLYTQNDSIILFKRNQNHLTILKKLTLEQSYIEPFARWEHQFEIHQNSLHSKSLGVLQLKRKEKVYNIDSTKSFLPQIELDIFPIAIADSIEKAHQIRTISLSCCFPKCGSIIIKTKNYVFWSDPWSIKASFNCSNDAIDYTRENARKIILSVSNLNFENIFDLVNALPTSTIKKN